MHEIEKERIIRKLKRRKRQMKKLGIDQNQIKKIHRAIRKLRDE